VVEERLQQSMPTILGGRRSAVHLILDEVYGTFTTPSFGLAGTAIETLVVHPGVAMINLLQHGSGLLARAFTPVAQRLLMGSPDGAAWPSLYAATSPDVRSGQFIGPAGRNQTSGTPKPVRLGAAADDPDEGAEVLASDYASWITGIRLLVDGGGHLRGLPDYAYYLLPGSNYL
jgi:NAD(P)-dependent dehydrogenase (short-subunit alcohol dehydrogenase family)